MLYSGFADEAADDLAGQIRATQALGWRHIEARSIDGVNLHDLDDAAFDRAAKQLADAGVGINCLGSTIANWGKPPTEDFAATLATVDRAVTRMRALGIGMVRLMSYAILKDSAGVALPDQMEAERFRRMREICARFVDNGIVPAHENCHTYGGMSWSHSLRLLENVPGLKLIFDTGNPPLTGDYSKSPPCPPQSAWEFYQKVRKHIAHVHIKDARWEGPERHEKYFYPGEGAGDVRQVIRDLIATGYDGFLTIEPHMEVVFHDASVQASADKRIDTYVEYGQRLMRLVEEERAK